MEGDILSVSDVIKQAISESGTQQKEVAAHMGWSPQNFANRLKNNTVDADEWVEIAKFLGYKVEMIGREKGDILKEKKRGVGDRVRKMVNGVTYDTEMSEHICNTSEFAGAFFELYKDQEGRLYIVLYSEWLEDGIIMPVDESHAEKFMEVCMYKTGQ